MSKGHCVYNIKWESFQDYKDWISPFKGDRKKARCKKCERVIDLSSMGESALKSHMKSAKHRQNCTAKGTLMDFSFSKESTTSEQLNTIPPPPPPLDTSGPEAQPKSTGTIENFFTKDDVLKAEILWTLNVVTNHLSFNSSKDTSKLFSAMFPDSNIAKQFQCGERKVAYICVFGPADYFLKMLKEKIKGFYVVMFDESLNKKLQEKQMDILIRYWDDESHEVKTRYFGSSFLGHGTAVDLMKHFSIVLESGLLVNNIVQISMDGPNVNWKFYGDLRIKLNNDFGSLLINIGSCGLHIMHNAFKRGVDATGWKVGSFLLSLYRLLKDAPARREDFIKVTSSTTMPLKFVSHRWLENVPVSQRAIDMWDSINQYVKAVEEGKTERPKNKSYEVVKESVKDKCFLAKLYYFKYIAMQLQPFLIKYQTDKPMLPFLYEDLCMLLRALMRRFVKRETLDGLTDDKLAKLKISDTKQHVNYKRIDVGFASEKLKGTSDGKPSERELMEFKVQCKDCLVAVLDKLFEKCPVIYSLVRHLSCFNPQKMASDKDGSSAHFKKVLTLLVNCNRVSEKDCDSLIQEYNLFLDHIPNFGNTKFETFDSNKDRLDALFYKHMSEAKFNRLFNVVKLVLLLSHGNASVERGFSVNKELEVENMKQQTLVAKRVICDHVNSVNGILNVELTKPLLVSVKQARQKYERYLEDERCKKKSAETQQKRKHVLDEIEEIKKKKRRTEADIQSLNDTADDLLKKAEQQGKLTLLTQANSLRKTAKDKANDIIEFEKSLEIKLKELKE